MKVTVLGSAAAEGFPGVWCSCETCRKAKALGGKDLRMRTCYLVDEDTFVDFGPDVYPQILKFGIDMLKVRRIVFTHSHDDHMNPAELRWRQGGGRFCAVETPIDVVGTGALLKELIKGCVDVHAYGPEALKLNFLESTDGKWLTSGDVEIFSIPAVHATGIKAQCQVLRRGGKTLFVCHDTGFLTEEAWKMLEGIRMDAVIIDGTFGVRDFAGSHMGGKYVVETRDRLVAMGCLAKDGLAVVNHFTHNGKVLHADLCAYFEPKGFQVGYDGMVLEF